MTITYASLYETALAQWLHAPFPRPDGRKLTWEEAQAEARVMLASDDLLEAVKRLLASLTAVDLPKCPSKTQEDAIKALGEAAAFGYTAITQAKGGRP